MKNKREKILYLGLLFIIVGGVYFRTLNYGLIWDSKIQIKQNYLIINNDLPIKEAFKHGYWEPCGVTSKNVDFYRPLTIVSYMLNKRIFGDSAASFRGVNIFIFYLILISLYFFLKRQNLPDYLPEILTLIFAVYPLNKDSIIWIVGRGDLLVVLYGFLSLLAMEYYFAYSRKIYLYTASFLFLIGLFTKESMTFFFSFFIIYEFIKKKKISLVLHFINFLFLLLYFFVKFKINGLRSVFFNFFHPIKENILFALSSLGYYFKSMIFPFYFSSFSFANEVQEYSYLLWGIVFIIFVLFMAYFILKNKGILMVPLLLILNFLTYYVIFAFANLYPHVVSTRYMFLPSIGILWIITYFIFKIKNNSIRYFIFFIIILSYVFSVLLNSYYYKNEKLYWEKTYSFHKNIPFVNIAYASILLKDKYYIEGERLLKKALKTKMKPKTLASLLVIYARLEYYKAEYDRALFFLKELSKIKMKNLNFLKMAMEVKADIFSSIGSFEKSEKIIKNLIIKFPLRELNYLKLFNLYVGYEKWNKAYIMYKNRVDHNLKIKNPFEIKKEIEKLSLRRKVLFFIDHLNYKKAIELFEKVRKNSIEDSLFLAELYFRNGRSKKGKEIIKEVYKRNLLNYNTLNFIGFFYLKKLSRPAEALYYFEKSYKINPLQERIKNIIEYIKNER